ncbi:MAG TPA: PQQ-dependent sugar dehydrogenase, partial [Actinoplanes sp.]|nr:PQQ-dependent sugar dehydrogenase [Actinoplanes sp.]
MDNRMIRTGRLRTVAVLLAATLAVTSGCAFGPPEPDRAGEPPRFPPPSAPADDPEHGDVAASVLAKGLKTPWGVAFLPDGSALVTERDTARILRVGPKSTTAGLTVSEVQTLTQVVADGEAGLLGIAVSPRYASDKTVFVSYSTATDNRVASLVLKGEPKPILTGLPRSSAHSGGQLAFGPDGYLYVTTAAGPTDASARDRKSLAGKILRMTVAGA